ncbi:hypothetical protein H4582DRAFT_2082521 [Lactarius indigo]|nr:hypothetical protein H4582DRAFT_2082521 [Lactarius indigo]
MFGNPTPRHLILRQKLYSYAQDSSRSRMLCHLSEERDVAFWHGFHLEDREVIWLRLLSKSPFQPSNISFHFEDVYICTRAAFAYDDPFSPWSQESKFEPPSVRHKPLVVEPIPQDANSFLESLDPQLYSPSFTVLESQQTQAHSAMLDQPNPTPMFSATLLPSASPSHPPTLVHSATDDAPIFTSMSPSSSLTSSMCLPSPVILATEEHPEPEHEPMSSITSTFSAPESKSASVSLIPASRFDASPHVLSLPHDHSLMHLLSPSTLSSLPQLKPSTIDTPLVSLLPDRSSKSLLSGTVRQSSRPCDLESTLVSSVDVVALSHPESSKSSLSKHIPFQTTSLEALPNVPISPHSMSPQQPLGLMSVGSDCSTFEISNSPAAASPMTPSIPQLQEPLLTYKVPSTKPLVLMPHPSLFHSSPLLLLSSTSVHFNFALSLVTATVLVSALLNIPTLSSHMRKFQSQQDIGNSQIGTLNISSHSVFLQQLQLRQYMPRTLHFIFDLGGLGLALESTDEDSAATLASAS